MTCNTAPTGRLVGATLLVSGCCIGSGMLGIPVISSVAGFLPSSLLLIFSWIFMALTGLFLLEVNLSFKEEVSLITLAGKTLGLTGKIVCWIFYLFLFYSIMVAYTSGSGQLFSDFIEDLTGFLPPDWIASSMIAIVLGSFVYFGTLSVDRLNRILILGLFMTCFLLMALGTPHINIHGLSHSNWIEAPFIIPAMVIGFGYHNLIPTLTTYLNHDAKKLKSAILIGTAIPLIIYLIWLTIMLGIIPFAQKETLQGAISQGDMTTRLLRNAVGRSYVVDIAEIFAFFAIATSFITVALGFVDFLADGLNIKKNKRGEAILCLMVLLPPFIISLVYPNLFLKALGYAGGFATVILFGVIPSLMVWSARYRLKIPIKPTVRGGKLMLIFVIVASFSIFLLQLLNELL